MGIVTHDNRIIPTYHLQSCIAALGEDSELAVVGKDSY